MHSRRSLHRFFLRDAVGVLFLILRTCAKSVIHGILFLLLHLRIWQQVEGGVVMVDVSISLIVGVVAGIAANYIYERFIHRNSR